MTGASFSDMQKTQKVSQPNPVLHLSVHAAFAWEMRIIAMMQVVFRDAVSVIPGHVVFRDAVPVIPRQIEYTLYTTLTVPAPLKETVSTTVSRRVQCV